MKFYTPKIESIAYIMPKHFILHNQLKKNLQLISTNVS
jgi:hypothetical protein